MAEYKTPGVYVEEVSTFPTSVVRVATAVPVFIGYTEISGADVKDKVIKVKSLVEYQRIFGGEPTTDGRSITVNLDPNHSVTSVDLGLNFYLYQSLRHFYANGGGDAYILSIGAYNSSGPDKDDLSDAIALLEAADEPTLLLVPDAYALTASGLGEVQVTLLAHCAKMKDRFSVLDVKQAADVATSVGDFRDEVGTQNLKYGAAYFPELKSTIGPDGALALDSYDLFDATNTATTLTAIAATSVDANLENYFELDRDQAKLDADVAVYGAVSKSWEDLLADWDATYQATFSSPAGTVPLRDADALAYITSLFTCLMRMSQVLYSYQATDHFENDDVETIKDDYLVETNTSGLLEAVQGIFVHHEMLGTATITSGGVTVSPAVILSTDFNTTGFDYDLNNPALLTGSNLFEPAADVTIAVNNVNGDLKGLRDDLVAAYDSMQTSVSDSLAVIGDLSESSKIVAGINLAIRNTGYTLPPSGAVTGAYASMDAARGVWKAPANISLNAVSEVIKMTGGELDDLNVPTDGQGKSINAIRLFRGQGNLIYGARTLAGNDNEWRYVPVRRLFNMVEESISKAIEPFVFESNDANTWLKVKGMIDTFLNGVWRDGGLAGGTPEDAYFVKVGIGQTMTAQDILEGKMIIEIGMAAVRPAEFVILKFSHKMQES